MSQASWVLIIPYNTTITKMCNGRDQLQSSTVGERSCLKGKSREIPVEDKCLAVPSKPVVAFLLRSPQPVQIAGALSWLCSFLPCFLPHKPRNKQRLPLPYPVVWTNTTIPLTRLINCPFQELVRTTGKQQSQECCEWLVAASLVCPKLQTRDRACNETQIRPFFNISGLLSIWMK